HFHDLARQRLGQVDVEAQIARPPQLAPDDKAASQQQQEREPQEQPAPRRRSVQSSSCSLSCFLNGFTFARMYGSPVGLSCTVAFTSRVTLVSSFQISRRSVSLSRKRRTSWVTMRV